MKRGFIVALCAVCAIAFTPAAFAKEPKIKEWSKMEKDDKGELKEVFYMTIDGIMVHETDPKIVPPPPVVTPAPAGEPVPAPSDAIVLFDGKDLSKWTSTKEGQDTKWILVDAAMSPVKDSGYIRTKQEFGSCQLHVEFATPVNVEGDGQGRGNSGVFLQGHYEVQVLDSYNNTTYFDGQCAALYGRKPPLVNACRKPGEWQTYDIVYHRPIFKGKKVVRKARFTVIHNGVLVHDNVELSGGTGWRGPHSISKYVPHSDKGPIQLQDHGNPVLFRNIWIRELKD